MNPSFDDRPRLKHLAGIHALIAGVSYYQDPDIPRLSSPCVSALKVYRWLMQYRTQLSLPLSTCRLLLSPSIQERSVEPALRSPQTILAAHRCSLEGFQKAVVSWRADAYLNSGNWTFFYFAGHGFETSPEQGVLIVEDTRLDYGQWKRVVQIKDLYEVMTPASDGTKAQRQLYFFDCCRESWWPAFPPSLPRIQVAPLHRSLFFATAPGSKAYARKGQTLFSRALLECLNLDAVVIRESLSATRACITFGSLGRCLRDKVPDLFHQPKKSLRPKGAESQRPETILDGVDTVFCSVEKS